MRTATLIVLSGVLASTFVAPAWPQPAATESTAAARLQDEMRDRWLRHIFWTCEAVQLAALSASAQSQKVARTRAADSTRRIASPLEPYYQEERMARLRELLDEHNTFIFRYLEALQTRDEESVNLAHRQLIANARELARIFAGTSNLDVKELAGLFGAHAGHHTAQIQQLLAGRHAEEARTWDAMLALVYGIADTLTTAVVQENPGRFEVVDAAPAARY